MDSNKKWECAFNPSVIDKNVYNNNQGIGFQSVLVTLDEIIKGISSGMAMSYQFADMQRKVDNFIQTEFTQVDIDYVRNLDELVKDPLIQNHAAFVYTTASYTPETPRLRVFFLLPTIIQDVKEISALNRSLTRRLGGDIKATSAAQMFYGSSNCYMDRIDRVMSLDVMTDLILDDLQLNQRDKRYSKELDSNDSPSNRSALTFDPKLMVRLGNGDEMMVENISKKTSIFCPFHYDKKPSAFVGLSKGNWFIFCQSSQCGKTRWAKGAVPAPFNFYSFEEAVLGLEHTVNAKQIPFRHFQFPLPIEPEDWISSQSVQIVCQDKLDIKIANEGITFVKSPKASGKSTALAKFINQTVQHDYSRYETFDEVEEAYDSELPLPKYSNERVLLIGHRRALIKSLCAQFCLNCYLDDNKYSYGENTERKKRYGVCLDSLFKIQDEVHSVIVIDEVEQVLTHFLSDTIGRNAEAIFNLFCEKLSQAKRIIVMDADISWVSFITLTAILKQSNRPPVPCHLIINTYLAPLRSISVFHSEAQLSQDLLQAIESGSRVYVTANSRKHIDALHKALTTHFGETKKMLAITSENSVNPEIQDFIANIKQRILDYDVVLTSPTLGTGVDITFKDNAQEIDCVYGFFFAQINTHLDMDQQLARVRHPKAVKVWIANRQFSFETDFDVLVQNEKVGHLAANVYPSVEITQPPDLFSRETLFMTFVAMVISLQRASKNSLKRHFIEYVKRQNYEIIDVPLDEIESKAGRKLQLLGKRMHTEIQTSRILNAATLTRHQLNEIHEIKESNEELLTNDLYAFYRTRTELFYRQVISADLIQKDRQGKTKQTILRFERLSDPRYIQNHLPVMPKNAAEKSSTMRLESIVKNPGHAIVLLHDILSTTPIFKKGQFILDAVFTTHDMAPFVRCLSQPNFHRFIENHFEMSLPKDLRTKPITFLNRLLKDLGLRVVEAKTSRSQAGGKTYYYHLDPAAYQFIVDIVYRRKSQDAWDFVNRTYGFATDEFDELYWEMTRHKKRIL